MKLSNKRLEKLRELIQEEIMAELFDSPAFKKSFTFTSKDKSNLYLTTFQDKLGQEVEVAFTRVDEKEESFYLDYSIDGVHALVSRKRTEYTLKHFTQVLATVAKAVEEFIKKYSPRAIIIDGLDSFFKDSGQKNRIYKYFISQLKDTKGYAIQTYKDTGTILKRENE